MRVQRRWAQEFQKSSSLDFRPFRHETRRQTSKSFIATAEGWSNKLPTLETERCDTCVLVVKILDLRRQLRNANEDASKCQAELDRVIRAASNNSEWAKQELEKKDALIHRLENEKSYLLRAKEAVEVERNQQISVLGDLAKQNHHYRAYLDRLTTDNGCPPLVLDDLEIDHGTLSSLVNGPSTSYHTTLDPHRGVSPLAGVDNHAAVPQLTAHSRFRNGDDLDISTIPLPTAIDTLRDNSQSSLQELLLQPLTKEPHSASEQHGTSLANQIESASPVSILEQGVLTPNASHQESTGGRREASLPLLTQQTPGAAEQAADEQDFMESCLSFDDTGLGVSGSCERATPVTTAPQPSFVGHQRRSLSRLPSDISMRSPPATSEGKDTGTGEVAHEKTLNDSSDPSSGDTDDDSVGDSDGDPDTSVDAGEDAIKEPDTVLASPSASNSRNHRQPEDETDAELKIAVRESYIRFGLDAHRLRFCYEPQPLDPTAINLNTNWKRRSKLNESAMEKLQQAGTEIIRFLPESDTPKATKRETDLIRRLCNCTPSQMACTSLKEVVGALRRERDVTKDELHLIEFELYSTLIIMKSQSEHEASH